MGEDYQAWLKSYEAPCYRGLRVNTGKLSVEKFEKISPFPLQKIPWIGNGFYLGEEANASKHPYYAAGLYYLQEPSAMTPASCLPIEEGDRVLDLCAAPGGKATELAAKLGGTGLLVANDISNSRAKGLLKNLELFGAGNILVTSETPERLTSYFEGFFDKILIDAPCSGEGMFRKEPSMVKDWLEHGPEYYAQLQRKIVECASRMLKPGGMLLYSTCTFSPEENEGTIAHLLEFDSTLRTVSLPSYEGFTPGCNGLTDCVRIYPHKMKGEGHFIALLQKDKEAAPIREKAGKPQKGVICKEWQEFSGKIGISVEEEGLRLYDKRLYSLPRPLWNYPIRGLRFLRTGLYLGDVGKNRFEPSQALAMTLKSESFGPCLNFPVEDERVIRYLKGETLDVDDRIENEKKSGWQLVCVDGFPLGWAKLVNGQLRNKYYAGWRW